MSEISIIMPLYNAAKYLNECLGSVLEQTYTRFEVICIDDASTDNTFEILEKFQKEDKRIKILSNKERCGAALSRNKGMETAQGKYLAFLDGDDIFDKNMLNKAYHTIEEQNADVVMYEYQHVPSSQIHNKLYKFHSQGYIDRYCKKSFSIQDCEPYEIINWGLGPWNKLYRKAFIQNNNLLFQDLPCANDIYFVSMALMLADRIGLVEDNNVMLYVRDHFGTDRISLNRDSMCNYKALLQIGQELRKRDEIDKLCKCFYYRVFFSLKDGLMADRNEKRARSFYYFLQEEGIDNLCLIGENCYNDVDEYLRRGLQYFKERSFESGWYKDENILKVCLHIKSDKVVELVNSFTQNNKKVAIWGAGDNGKALASFCREHRLEIEAIIDRSEEKQGSLLFGYKVVSAQKVLDCIQVIIVSAKAIYTEVLKEVEGRDIQIVDINSFFRLF